MANKHLRGDPHKINEDTWWYETSGGIEIYSRHYGNADVYSTKIAKISWRSIRAALKRKDQKG